jgi:predicted aspartyl protease
VASSRRQSSQRAEDRHRLAAARARALPGRQGLAGARRREPLEFSGSAVEIRRAPDGHYHWPGRLNGVATDFVDTGATTTAAVPLALAERAGLVPESASSPPPPVAW